jgi:YVTN family beta-propeller protein
VIGAAIGAIVVLSVEIASAAPFAYVPNQLDDTVSIIDIATNTVIATPKIAMEFDEPGALAATPDAKHVYVVGDSQDGPVWIIDTATQTTKTPGTASFSVGDQLKAIAITPDGLAYYATETDVAIGDTKNGDMDAGMINFAQGGPAALTRVASNSDGSRLYYSDSFNDAVWAVDTHNKSGDLLDTFTYECAISTVMGPCVSDNDCPSGFCMQSSVLSSPWGLAVGADGRYLYVANHAGIDVTVLDTASKHCQAGDKQNMPCSALPDAASPDCPGSAAACLHGFCPCNNVLTSVTPNDDHGNHSVALAPDGKHVYVGGENGTISIIDTTSNTLSGSIPNDNAGQLVDLALTPDGSQLYAVDVTFEKLWVIATATSTVTTSIPLGTQPVSIVIPVVRAAPPPTPTPTGSACIGDCDGSHTVAINEIITLVNILLGSSHVAQCASGLSGISTDSQVNVATIVQAVNHLLDGCS